MNSKVEKIEEHMSAIMDILELDRTPSNIDTPKRIAKMYVNELFENRNNLNIEKLGETMKVFPAENNNEVKVVVPFKSMCEHHFIPFMGDVTVTYIPNRSIIGLSKIPRVVKYFSRKPQLQEQITEEICGYLNEVLDPMWIKVEIEATHMCVEMRGIESPCVTYTESECKQVFDID